MLVTTFYLALTFINAWRMRSLKSHLLKFMSWKSSAVLYKFSSETDTYVSEMNMEGGPHDFSNFMEVLQISVVSNSISPLKAKLIIERKVHYITDVIEITETTRMCRLRPIQFIDINRWFSIANGLPFWTSNIFQQPDSTPKLCVFIECEMEPHTDEVQNDIVTLESLGQVWAWRADKNLEFIVVIPFNKLLELSYKFLYGSLIINEKLPVTRIQTVYATGVPYQPDDVSVDPLRKIIREAHKSCQETDWTYYSAILKQMCREVFPRTIKTSPSNTVSDISCSDIPSMPSQIMSPQPTDSTEYTDIINHSEPTQELIRALSQEQDEPIPESSQKSIYKLNGEPIQESRHKSIQELSAELIQESSPKLAQKQKSIQELYGEPIQESGQKSTQEQNGEPIQESGQKLTQEPNGEPIQKSGQKSTQEPNGEPIQESGQKSTQELNGEPIQESSHKLIQEVSAEPIYESSPKLTQKQKQKSLQKQPRESRPEPLQEPRQTSKQQTTQESLSKPSEEPKQESTGESTQETTQEATIVRSETIAIRQKISPSRKRNKNNIGNVSTTIESVTTHRRITSLVPPSQERQTSRSTSPESSTSSVASGDRKKELPKSNALDVLVYSESLVAKNNLIATLKNVLDPDRYTIYPVSLNVLCEGAWKGKVAMIAVVGNTGGATAFLLKYFLDGGRLLAICSDLLQSVVPYYRTAEIRENEIVQFSYDKWKSVKMKHHVLCFQASPAKKQFSSESDRHVMEHELVIDVLANEETWRTPSLIQVVDDTNHGVSIFSQIHLETNPAEYLGEEGTKNNKNRYEILFKILGDIISLHVKDTTEMDAIDYTEGYLFGDVKRVQSYMAELLRLGGFKKTLKMRNVEIEWLIPRQKPTHPPSQKYLPVRLRETPKTFCYETYLQNLTSSAMGRVLLYADVMGSTAVWSQVPIMHGLAVVTRRQLAGQGRSNNRFISPPGQAILSLQIWQKVNDTISLVQNIAALAAVFAIRSDTPYEPLNIRIKWPNDIYYGRNLKIGGVLTTADVMDDNAHINMGIGVNISNSVPTTCVNDIIKEYNAQNNAELEQIKIEWFLARFCSHFERILDGMSTEEGKTAFFREYYEYWLHTKEEIGVINKNGTRVSGVICGMDKSGFLLVDTPAGRVTVNPDGNSFDLMANLIVAKY